MTVEEKKATYQILREGAYSDYTIIHRNTSYCPYVVCYGFDKATYSWAQGHYHNTFDDALLDLYEQEMKGLQQCVEAIEESQEIEGE